jgi:hypothetical protein
MEQQEKKNEETKENVDIEKGKSEVKVNKSNKSCACMTGSKCNKGVWVLIALVLLLCAGLWYRQQKDVLTPDAAKAKVVKYVTDNLVQPGTDVSVKEIVKESGLYKVVLNVQKQEITAYVTTDGKRFFPQSMDLDVKPGDEKATAEKKDVPKNDKPVVELFVMSYCPYGTQIEKGILPVVAALSNKIDYELKFVDYAMHGKKEIDENVRQYCIEKDQNTKFDAYLTCFLQKGEGTEASCMKTTGVDAAKVASCMSATDKQFSLTEKFNDKTKWSNSSYPPFDVNKEDNEKYGVQGSPTLVINGVEADTQRDSASIMKTICGAFTTAPAECAKEMPSDAPAPGFGSGTAAAGSTSDAACGSN